jgi:hypothetical protein
MTGWGDYDRIPSSEVDFEGQSQTEFERARLARDYPLIQKQLELEKVGSTVHVAGCPCGFCKAGITAL